MRKQYLLFILLFFITACTSNDIKNVEKVELSYWENQDAKPNHEYIDDKETV